MTTATQLNLETKAIIKSVKDLMDCFYYDGYGWDEEFRDEILAYQRSYGETFANQWIKGQLKEEFGSSPSGGQAAFAYIDTAVELLLKRTDWTYVSQYVLNKLRRRK